MHDGSPVVNPPGARQRLDPYIKLLPFFGIGILVMLIVVGSTWWVNRGGRVELAGSVKQIRTVSPEELSTIALIDFRAHNTSDYTFNVKNVRVFLMPAQGDEVKGHVLTAADTDTVLKYYPAAGQRYNPSLMIRHSIPAGQTQDRMVAARFDMPEAAFQQRRQLRIVIDELDGPVSEIAERAQQ